MIVTTFREILRRAGQRIQNLSTSTSNDNDLYPKLKVWANERYDRIVRSYPWEELTRIKRTGLQIVASQRGYSLPRNIGQIISIFDATNGLPIKKINAHEHIRNHASALDQLLNIQTSDPTRYYEIGKYTVQDETGSTAEKINVVSDSSSDVTPKVVHIKGLVNSIEVEEDVVLTGTSSAQSVNTYDATQKLEISIGTNDGTSPALAGSVTVTGATSGNTLTKISKFELATRYRWIEVSPLPNSTGTQPQWDIWYRQEIEPLTDDNDIPLINCAQEIIYGVYADALREDGQEQEANIADQKFGALVAELWASTQNSDSPGQFIPQDTDAILIDDYGRVINID